MAGKLAKAVQAIKLKKCKMCSVRFRPFTSLQVACGIACALDYGVKERERKQKRELMEFRKNTESIGSLTKKAQASFNKFIRVRDHDQPCISCNTLNPGGDGSGGKWDCGHYRTVGACKALRFSEVNAHRQCKRCNSYLGGNYTAYRAGLINRIGLAAIEWIEGHHETPKRSREELMEIAKHYNQKAKELLKNRAG